jgi:predicted outer membrane protein
VRTPGKKTALFLLLALIALVVAGCGGGGDETETTTPTVEEPTALTQDELIEQGDGICAEVNAAVGALSSSETEGQSEQSEKVANLYLGMLERLQDLGAPDEDDGS